MNRFKNYLIAGAALSVLAIMSTIMNSRHAAAQRLTDGLAVRIVSPLPMPVSGSIPPNAFTIPPQPMTQAGIGPVLMTPDPPGTRYAISSLVVTNPTEESITVSLRVRAYTHVRDFTNGTCLYAEGEAGYAAGPELRVQPNSTAALTFPQPFVTEAASGPGPFVCLTANVWAAPALVGMNWSAVGYRILP